MAFLIPDVHAYAAEGLPGRTTEQDTGINLQVVAKEIDGLKSSLWDIRRFGNLERLFAEEESFASCSWGIML
jgi:hypothetical protein